MAMLPGTVNAMSPFYFRSEYEIFKPMSEWQRDEESYTLIIYLPGYVKERLKAETDKNTIRVRGERLIASNKWNRFLEEFQIPENCDTKSIHARFQKGILTIMLPRKKVGNIGAQDKKRDTQEAIVPTKTTSINGQKQATPQKEPSDTKPQQGYDNIPPYVNPAISSEKPTDEENLEPSPARKWRLQEENDENRRQLGAENAEAKTKPITSQRSEKPLEKFVEQRGRSMEKSKSLTDAEIVTKKFIDKENKMKDEVAEDRELTGKWRIKPAAINHSVLGLKKHMKIVKGLAECKEERKLLVNMGMAMLVIVALGAVVVYTLKSETHKH